MSNNHEAQRQNGSEDMTSSERSAVPAPKMTSNRKRGGNATSKVEVLRKANMVKYDSSTHVLSLERKIVLSDGTTPMELSGKLNLDGLSEPERQRIIAVAKLITNWCNGHDVSQSNATKDKDGKVVKQPSTLNKVNSTLSKTQDEKPASDGASPQK